MSKHIEPKKKKKKPAKKKPKKKPAKKAKSVTYKV